MDTDNLTFAQLSALLTSVFALQEREKWLTIMVDLPDARLPDNEAWLDRRRIAGEWFTLLHEHAGELPFTGICFCAYPHVGSNNNDLPELAVIAQAATAFSPSLPDGDIVPLRDVLAASSVVLALTQMSSTAPLKLLAAEYGFRGATLPGFTRAMIPLLRLDYDRVHARVMEFKERMDRADGVSVALEANGTRYETFFDLRFRPGHASGGLIRRAGIVGNLPSGEAYIVPYEGEREGDPSRTAGELPVQFYNEVVVYRIENNSAVEVLTSGAISDAERRRLVEEPAYGNMAEVGIGVLGEWGVQAMGTILVDEKLGLHIAFGRSDHFGGITGAAAFNDRDRVVHIDRVYVPSTQPLVHVAEVAFHYPDGQRETIIADGSYTV